MHWCAETFRAAVSFRMRHGAPQGAIGFFPLLIPVRSNCCCRVSANVPQGKRTNSRHWSWSEAYRPATSISADRERSEDPRDGVVQDFDRAGGDDARLYDH